MIMGVVADDVTGSNDIGIMFAKSGYRVHVYSYEQPGDFARSAQDAPDITILDTNSRLDPPDAAYQKVFHAAQELRAAGCKQFFNKTCSVFRGNIGVEFDAMLDALQQDFAVVVLGFPKNGRTTVGGIHYVHGKRLEDSEFRSDPAHPMRQSNLLDILGAQTRRAVGLIDHTVVQRGPDPLRKVVEAARSRYGYVILDVPDQGALKTIARAVYDSPVLCGSSALAEELPSVWGRPTVREKGHNVARHAGTGILCAAGSLMPQTAAQIAYLQAQGVPAIELNPLSLLDDNTRGRVIQGVAVDASHRLRAGSDVVLHTACAPHEVALAKAEATRRGWSDRDLGRLVSSALAEAVADIAANTGQNRMLIAGGETSNAVCKRLGVTGLRIWQEIQPGLPSCITLTDAPLLLVLKSGSFGSPAFFAEAIAHLKAQ